MGADECWPVCSEPEATTTRCSDSARPSASRTGYVVKNEKSASRLPRSDFRSTFTKLLLYMSRVDRVGQRPNRPHVTIRELLAGSHRRGPAGRPPNHPSHAAHIWAVGP